MARAKLTNPTNDLISDNGSVLWSFVKGEQLEFPVDITFISNAAIGYTYEAVVVEADNIIDQVSLPTTVKQGGVHTTLVVRVPIFVGSWSPSGAYTQAEVVSYNNKYYVLNSGIARTSSISPDLDSTWSETTLNKVYVQFPKTLGATWAVQPGVNYMVYGFFELRITEPTNPVYQRTWKPVRGMVEIQFSPTDEVPDL